MVSEVDDELPLSDVVHGQLSVGHLGELGTINAESFPLGQSANRDVQMLHQLLQLLNREFTYVTVRGHVERLCKRHINRRFC